jgi:hypothetical protein
MRRRACETVDPAVTSIRLTDADLDFYVDVRVSDIDGVWLAVADLVGTPEVAYARGRPRALPRLLPARACDGSPARSRGSEVPTTRGRASRLIRAAAPRPGGPADASRHGTRPAKEPDHRRRCPSGLGPAEHPVSAAGRRRTRHRSRRWFHRPDQMTRASLWPDATSDATSVSSAGICRHRMAPFPCTERCRSG